MENLLALLKVGQFDMNLPVKTSCTEQCGIEYVGAVGSRQDDDTGVGTETVHLRQQLVQCALALVVTAGHHAFPARTTDSIYLVNEDDGRCFLFGLTEEVTDTAGTDSDKHLHEVRTAHREERHTGFAGNRFGEQGLTRTRRTYEQRAFRNLRTYLRVFLGVFEKLHYLLHLLLGAVQTGYIFEGHFVLFLVVEQLSLRFAHTEDTAYTA